MLDETRGDMVRQVLASGIFLAVSFGLGRSGASASAHFPVSIAVLLGYCLLSVAWAIDPLISIRRLALTAMTIWVAFRCVEELGYRRTLYILRVVLLGLLVANFLAVAVSDIGVHAYAIGEDPNIVGNWRGIVPDKNSAGAVCAFTVMVFVFDRRGMPFFLSAATVAAALIFLLFSQSKTSQGMLALALLCGWLIRGYGPQNRSLLLVFAAVAAGVLLRLASLYGGVLEDTINDPYAFTGRAQIWPRLLQYAGENLWTGAGFGSFWGIGNASPIRYYASGWVADIAAHGHNGYLDLLVTIGLPGLLLALAVLIVWPTTRLLLSFSISATTRSLLLSIIVFCVGHNLTESSLLDRLSSVQIFLTIAISMIYLLSNRDGGHLQLRQRMFQAVGMQTQARHRVL